MEDSGEKNSRNPTEIKPPQVFLLKTFGTGSKTFSWTWSSDSWSTDVLQQAVDNIQVPAETKVV